MRERFARVPFSASQRAGLVWQQTVPVPRRGQTVKSGPALRVLGVIAAIAIILFLVLVTGDNEWEAALKQGGGFSSEQWSTSTCETILEHINEGYVTAWFSQQTNEIRVSKRAAAEGDGVPILGTHLRHCRD